MKAFSRLQPSSKKQRLAIYPRDGLGSAHHITISALHQFDQPSRRRPKFNANVEHSPTSTRSKILSESTPLLSAIPLPLFPLPARTHITPTPLSFRTSFSFHGCLMFIYQSLVLSHAPPMATSMSSTVQTKLPANVRHAQLPVWACRAPTQMAAFLCGQYPS
jgi:hypothetical protein